jgi:hypothetical protein
MQEAHLVVCLLRSGESKQQGAGDSLCSWGSGGARITGDRTGLLRRTF